MADAESLFARVETQNVDFHALERAVILGDGPVLTPDDFPPGLMIETDSEGGATVDDLRAAVRDYERHHIRRVLKDCADDKREAA